ncbi:MAG: ABC transporter permease [candidate division KSB1 bacterium]|nr:ABC transporter permease [candidate division KSB1 bacterium]
MKNYLRIACRGLLKHKSYTAINVFGLTAGMAVSFLILFFVRDELSYDRYHRNAEQVYRLLTLSPSGGGSALQWTKESGRVIGDLPGAISGTRIVPSGGVVHYRNKRFNEDRFFFADSTIFEVFTFPLVMGNPKTALAKPNSVVITQEMAEKYFAAEDPIGKVLTLEDTLYFQVTGVLAHIPHNSHFKFDFLGSLMTVEKSVWSGLTYILLDKNTSPLEAEKRITDLFKKYDPRYTFDDGSRLHLQPLTQIHFNSHFEGEIEPNGEMRYIYIFSVVAIFVLLLACINFINLTTARSAQRAKEVGMRKVVGASRKQLIGQFIGESIILSLIALCFALVLVEFVLPTFNALVDKKLVLEYNDSLLLLLGIALFVGVVAGSYPAFFLSSFQPAQVLKGKFNSGLAGYAIRKGLVVAQFTISIILAIGTIVVYNQLEFIQKQRLGFNKEQVVVVVIREREVQRRYRTFRNTVLEHQNVLSAAASSSVPGRVGIKNVPQMLYKLPGKEDQNFVNTYFVDEAFLKTLEIGLVAGRNFSEAFPTDVTEAVLLNETAVQKFGWASAVAAVGQELEYWHRGDKERGFKKAMVIGVTKNFNYASLHSNIEPLILRLLNPQNHTFLNLPALRGVVTIRIGPNNVPDTMEYIASKWREFDPAHPFEYFFLDDSLNKLYQAEQRLAKIFSYFSALAIIIASLGMFGLATFTAVQRTKEIGMRKVLGASVLQIMLLLSKDFAKLVAAAFLIAVPVAYFMMYRWLQKFAYHVEISILTFFQIGLMALIIVLLTVSYHSIKIALTNPVNALRYE